MLKIFYSQKAEDVTDLAEKYVLESKGQIQTVIGLDIEYEHREDTRKAAVSVWRAAVKMDKRSGQPYGTVLTDGWQCCYHFVAGTQACRFPARICF